MEADMRPKLNSSLKSGSTLLNKEAEAFEEKLREDNMHLFRQLRLEDFMEKAKPQGADTQLNK
jgi:hypothetical protein